MKKIVTWFSLTIIIVFAVYISLQMAKFDPTFDGIANVIVHDTLEKTKAINSVTAVVFDFRGYDTLGESFVLFTAITASAAVLRKPVQALSNKAKGGK